MMISCTKIFFKYFINYIFSSCKTWFIKVLHYSNYFRCIKTGIGFGTDSSVSSVDVSVSCFDTGSVTGFSVGIFF